MEERILIQIKDFQEEQDLRIKAKKGVYLSDELWSAGEFNLSREYANHTLTYACTTGDKYLEGSAYQSLANSYNIQGDSIRARELMSKSYELLQDSPDDYAVYSCLTNMGSVELCLGNYDLALSFMFKAVERAQAMNDNSCIAVTYNNISIIFRKIKDYPSALLFSKKALKLRWAAKESENLGSSFNNIGNIYLSLDDLQLAMGYYKRAKRIWEDRKDKRQLPAVYNNIAGIYKISGKLEQAIEYYKKSMTISEELGIKNFIITSCKELGNIFMETDLELAREYFKKALLCTENFNNNSTLLSLYKDYADFCKLTGDHETVIEYLEKYLNLSQKKFNEDMSQQIVEAEARFQLQQNEKEKEFYRVKNEELKAYNLQIEQQKQELTQLNNSKDTILSIVSHDLKNAIGSIHSIVDLIKLEVLNDNLVNYVEIINISSERAIQLVNDILEAHQMELESFQLDLDVLDLNMILKAYESNFKLIAYKKDITLTIDYSETPLYAQLNEERVWQILNNLISNAVKFTQPKGSIIITSSLYEAEAAKYCQLSIKDTGIGIAENIIPCLFDKFTKASRRGTLGEATTGLGLSIVKRLMDLHNGVIEVKSIQNVGSEFILKFPYTRDKKVD